jgi:hypothetical protein
LKFQAGSVVTTPIPHAIEWDGSTLYATNSSSERRKLIYADDTVTTSAIASTGIINFYCETQDVLSYTTSSSGNFTINVAGKSDTSLNSIMAAGRSRTIVFTSVNGASAFNMSGFQIDGTATAVKWYNATTAGAWPTGNANATDMYTITIIKLSHNAIPANSTYAVFGSVAKYV